MEMKDATLIPKPLRRFIYQIISNTGLQYLPKRIDNFFPILIALEWMFLEISADDFHYLPQDGTIGLLRQPNSNRIDSLDGFITFTVNRIMNVGQDLFANLNQLREVHFHNNHYAANSLESIQHLKLQLSANCQPKIHCRLWIWWTYSQILLRTEKHQITNIIQNDLIDKRILDVETGKTIANRSNLFRLRVNSNSNEKVKQARYYLMLSGVEGCDSRQDKQLGVIFDQQLLGKFISD